VTLDTGRIRRWVKSSAVLLALLSFNHYLEHVGFFEPFALASYDWMQRFVRETQPKVAEPVVTLFTLGADAQGPAAESMIVRMIQTIACGEPAVIGIDWRSGRWNPRTLAALQTGPAARTPIVWAREMDEQGNLGPVAGEVPLPPHWSTGIAAVHQGWDHAIRRHQRWFSPERESFSWVLAKTYCRSPGAQAPGCRSMAGCPGEECGSDALLDFANGSDTVDQFPSQLLLGLSARAPAECSALPDAGRNPLIQGRVVLIGDGSQSDMHATPGGRRMGVHIIAHAVQSDLLGLPLKPIRTWLVILLHFLSVVVIVGANRNCSPFAALAVNVIFLPAGCIVLSYFAYNSVYHWFNFAPLVGGAIIHQLWEQAESNHELRHTLEKLRNQAS